MFKHTCTITSPGTDSRPVDSYDNPVGDAPAAVSVYAGKCLFSNDTNRIRKIMGGDESYDNHTLCRLPELVLVQIGALITGDVNGVTKSGSVVRVDDASNLRGGQYPRLVVKWSSRGTLT